MVSTKKDASTTGDKLSAMTTFKKNPNKILLTPKYIFSTLKTGFCDSWYITSLARKIGPATSWGKKII